MVLIFNDIEQTTFPADTRTLFSKDPAYIEVVRNFLNMPVKIIGPAGLLYVSQREMAVVPQNDKNVEIIGSDAATTCIIVVLRHSGSGAVALAHLDGYATNEAITKMLEKIQELSSNYSHGKIELQLIGGYSDEKGYSEDIFYKIMLSLHKSSVRIHLTLPCVGELNTIVKNNVKWPTIYGVGINLKTAELFPAIYPEQGPDTSLRHARYFTGITNILDIYDSQTGQLRISPFIYEPQDDIDLWLNKNDRFLLEHLSTSPDVEPPYFVNQLRKTLKFIQENPHPAETVFPNNRSRCYCRDESTGCWKFIN